MDPATAAIVATIATPLVKAAIAGIATGITAAGAAIARYFYKKTGNEALAVATDEVFQAASGAFAAIEAKRIALPVSQFQLTDDKKAELITDAVDHAKDALGVKHVKTLEKAKGKVGLEKFLAGEIESQNLFHSTTEQLRKNNP